ncbi:hypothetical protein K461DRAFT_146479 [Myriangium duriaei CBS 260.36]|uniref:Uncharacterized protein n=1 Tax=Myriangium duriaei CBS 260.36 TaxID=1168546 RepID=A0A9P4J2T8_9PEZI|nr:hypothetical protein K461DRAFT_146479 [Myriangium duriaei CBS 260.36]
MCSSCPFAMPSSFRPLEAPSSGAIAASRHAFAAVVPHRQSIKRCLFTIASPYPMHTSAPVIDVNPFASPINTVSAPSCHTLSPVTVTTIGLPCTAKRLMMDSCLQAIRATRAILPVLSSHSCVWPLTHPRKLEPPCGRPVLVVQCYLEDH